LEPPEGLATSLAFFFGLGSGVSTSLSRFDFFPFGMVGMWWETLVGSTNTNHALVCAYDFL
jgi:hypothetical protein